jgi:hypothetical protein
MTEPASTINFYQTISPDMVLRQREKIAKWVFNIRDPKEAELIITNQGFLYFERNYKHFKNSRRPKQEITSKKEAEMILKKHADNFNKKMQATLSGDPMNPVAVTYFRWNNFRIEILQPKAGSILGVWEAILYVELPGIQKPNLQIIRKINLRGEYIRIEFTAQQISKLQFNYLPVIRSASSRLIQADKDGKKIINPIIFIRTSSTEVLPYYTFGGRLIPAIQNQAELVLYSRITYDLPNPPTFGNQDSLFQVLGGQGSNHSQGTPGLVNMQMNFSIQIVAGKTLGALNPEMIQAGQIQSIIERTIQNDLNGLILTDTPVAGKSITYKILEQNQHTLAANYYNLNLSISAKTWYQAESDFLSAFSWAGFPAKGSQVIFCLNPDWPDTQPISSQLVQYSQYRKSVLDSIYRRKKMPIANPGTLQALDEIRTFCKRSASILCIYNLIEEGIDAYKNKILTIGKYFYYETESDEWLREKLNGYGILLFSDMDTALQNGPPGMTIIDLQNEITSRAIFSISTAVSQVMNEYLLIQPDFDYRFRNKIVKYYHVCNLFGTAPVVILNPDIGNKSNAEITCGLLEGISGQDSNQYYNLNQTTNVKACLINCFN